MKEVFLPVITAKAVRGFGAGASGRRGRRKNAYTANFLAIGILYHVRQITYDSVSVIASEAKQSPSLCDCFGLASFLATALRLARNDKYLTGHDIMFN